MKYSILVFFLTFAVVTKCQDTTPDTSTDLQKKIQEVNAVAQKQVSELQNVILGFYQNFTGSAGTARETFVKGIENVVKSTKDHYESYLKNVIGNWSTPT